LCKYHDACLANTNVIFCEQVKNKPSVEYSIIMQLISWIHSLGSENKVPEVGTERGRKRTGRTKRGIYNYL
jgi:hypothetical protein